MATPHITGLISVMKAFNPNLNLSDIKNIFANNSLTVGFSPEKVMPKFADGGKIVAGLVGITQTQPLPSPPLAGEGIATTPTQSKDVAILDRRITHTAWNPN